MEVVKLLAAFATPIVVAIVGFFLNKRLKSIDDAQWQNRKIIEKRIDIYDRLAPKLNLLYCFSLFLGYWKEVTPPQALQTKRELDKEVNIYRHLLSDKFYQSYNNFIHTLFRTFTGHGKDALIRSAIANEMADRRVHMATDWKAEYESMFDTNNSPAQKEIVDAYLNVMEELRKCIGLK